jgi:N6-L-threonylcarbamoyladenine synthase
VILSQDVHRIFGGVVPGSRAGPICGPSGRLDQALREAGASRELTGIAATAGPGLIGPLLVGFTYGKTLAWRRGLPFIGVHHLEGHLFAATLEHPDLAPPFVALLVSGGHTMLLHVAEWGRYELMGQTRDDAAGEAFDKVAALLKLGYPGGPVIERLAEEDHLTASDSRGRSWCARETDGSSSPSAGPRPRSFARCSSRTTWSATGPISRARFQDAVLEVLATKTALAVDECGVDRVVLGGGVACNAALAASVGRSVGQSVRVVTATPRLNTDNAAMIAAAERRRPGRAQRVGHGGQGQSGFPGLHPFEAGTRQSAI